MAKRRKSSKCPEPINTLLDVAGAATLGLYVKHKVKKDFESGCGEESAKAAAMVFGMGSMRRGSQGTINLGGLVGLNSALKDIERQQAASTYDSQPYVSPIEPSKSQLKLGCGVNTVKMAHSMAYIQKTFLLLTIMQMH